MWARTEVVLLFQIGKISSKSSAVYKCPRFLCSGPKVNILKSTSVLRLNDVIFRTMASSALHFTAFVFCVLNKPLIRLKCEPPLGFWVRSHHCLCHHLLWLPNLCSRNQGSQTSTETNTLWRGAVLRLCTGSNGFNTFNRTQSQFYHFCTESRRSPTHGKTTVRWYTQLTTPWELAVPHANGDQCTDRWICFSPKLLIIWTTLMLRGHSTQVTLTHLLSLCFVWIWLNPLTIILCLRYICLAMAWLTNIVYVNIYVYNRAFL